MQNSSQNKAILYKIQYCNSIWNQTIDIHGSAILEILTYKYKNLFKEK